MSRILLVPFGATGHVLPAAALAAELRAAGHQSLMYLDDSSAAGIACGPRRAPRDWRPGGPPPAELVMGGNAGELSRYMFFGPLLRLTHELVELIESWRADLVIGDVFQPAGGLAAQCAGRPWLSISFFPRGRPADYPAVLPPALVPHFDATSTRAALGLPAQPGENLLGRISPLRHLVAGTAGFVGQRDLPEQVELVGPLVRTPDGDPVAPAPGRPPRVVVATTSTPTITLGSRAFARRRYLTTVLAALGTLPVRATVTLGPDQPVPDPVPGNVEVLGLVPHEGLLAGAAALVCNGGWGSTGLALVHGVPQVQVPITVEQQATARRCAELGFAVCLDPDTADAAAMADAVRAVSADPAYRAAALEFARAARAAPALPRCVSIVDEVLSGKR